MSDDNGGKDKDTGRQDPPKDDPGKDDDGDDEDDDDSGGKPWTPPTQEEYERLQRTAQRRKEERLQARRELADLKKAKPAPKKKESEDDDSDRVDSEAAKEAGKWRAVAVKQAAAASLSAAGFTGTAKQAARLTKLMDLEDSEPGRDGSFDFEDDVEELREEFPHLFEDPRNGKRTPKVRTATGRGEGSKPDPVKRTSDRLLRSAGYR